MVLLMRAAKGSDESPAEGVFCNLRGHAKGQRCVKELEVRDPR